MTVSSYQYDRLAELQSRKTLMTASELRNIIRKDPQTRCQPRLCELAGILHYWLMKPRFPQHIFMVDVFLSREAASFTELLGNLLCAQLR
jgi:hypothetical protein